MVCGSLSCLNVTVISNTRLGECKATMTMYMECLKENSNNSTPCRALSRDYLDCRMKK